MEAVTMAQPGAAESTQEKWSAPARVGFRFAFLYFGLYCLLTQIVNSVLAIPNVDVPDWGTLRPFRDVVFWTAAHLFGLKTPLVYSGSGSGDKQFDWVLLFCMLAVALIGTAMWTALDRRRRNYATLQKWFALFLLLCLGGQMFAYGMVKAIPLQMPYPFLSRLAERFGDFSPMGVLWWSVGAAPAYERFAGCAELAGGLLLISRRTRMLGLFICLADMTQVFVLNMTYDVPVKLLSFHLILISLFLLLPARHRIVNFFLLGRAAEAPQDPPLFTTARARKIAAGVVAFLWIWMLGNQAFGAWQGWHQYGPGRQKSALYGIWNIQEFTQDGKPQPLVVTDAGAWRSMIFDFPQYTEVELMDGSRGYNTRLDQRAGTLALTYRGDKSWQAQFQYTRPAFDRLTLQGTMAGHSATLHLQRVDEKKFLLESRGFHWVQDYPLNR